MTGKRFKAKRHCTEGNCRNFVLDKPNHRFVLMVHSWEDCKDVCELLNELHKINEQLRHDATILIQSNQDYRKENEQLKCGNKNLKATLNDFINILNRLQSNPNDKQTIAVARDMLQNMGKELEK